MTDTTVNLIVRANARELAAAMQQGSAAVRGFAGTAVTQGRAAQAGLAQAGAGADQVTRQVNAAKSALVAFFSVQAVRAVTTDLLNRADGYANLTAKIKLATDSQAQFRASEQAVFDIAQRTSASLDSTATLYSRINAALKDQGGTQREVLDLTETINQAMAVSGASAEESAGAILQLAQAFASGTLRGDEFNSVNEQAPRLMQALANSLGITRGELRALAEQGKLTSDKLRTALSGDEASKIASEYEKLPLTVGRAKQQLDNALTRFIGQESEATGTTAALSAGIAALANNLGPLANAAGLVAAVFAGRVVGSLTASAAAALLKFRATVQAMRAEQEEAVAALAQAQAATRAAQADVERARTLNLTGAAAGRVAAAEEALAVAQNAETAAAARATLAQRTLAGATTATGLATRALSGALALMGGPIGVVITGMALLAASFSKAAAEARQLKVDAQNAIEASQGAIQSENLLELQRAGQDLIQRRAQAQSELAQLKSDRERATFDLVGAGLGADGFQKASTLDQKIRETEASVADLNRQLGQNTQRMQEVSAAQANGARTAQQVTKDNAAYTQQLQKDTEQRRLNLVELQKGYRARLIAEAVAANGVKSEKDLSAALVQQIDANAKAKAAEDAASEAKKSGAQADRAAASAAKAHATEVKKLAEEQRQFLAETAQLQASNKGDLFGAAEQANQAIANAQREGAAAGVSQADIDARVAALKAETTRAVQQLVDSGRIELLQGTGQTADAALAQAKQKYQEIIDFFVAKGDENSASIYRKLFNVDVAKGQLEQLQAQVQAVFDSLDRQQQSLQTQVQTGTISEYEARSRLVALYKDQLGTVDQLLPQMEALARASGDPQALANVQRIRAELEQMRGTTSLLQEQVGQTFTGAFSNALQSLALGTANLREAVRGFFADMASGLARMASQALAQAAFSKIASLFNRGNSNDVGAGAAKLQTAALATGVAGGVVQLGATSLKQAAQQLAAAAATLLLANSIGGVGGFADGGYTGPGGKYQVAGVVHAGEGVLSQPEIRAIGGEHGFYALRRAISSGTLAFPRIASIARVASPRASYADGGFVNALAPSMQNFLRVYLYQDVDQLRQAILNHPDTEKYVVVKAGENGQAIQAEW